MELKPWKKISEEVVATNPWWEYRCAKFETAKGEPINYHYMHDQDAVIFIVIREDGKIPLVAQYRALYDQVQVEIPMGGVKNSKSPEEALADELAEELRVSAAKNELIGSFGPSTGRLDNTAYVYICTELSDAFAERDTGEELQITWHTADEVDEIMTSGEIFDGMSIAAWFLARKRVREMIDGLAKNG